MKREEIKNIVRHVFHFYDVNAENRNWTDINEACGEILKALEQEPTDEKLHREREQAYMQGYEDASKKFRQEPCEDAVSRAKAIEICKKHGHDNSAHYISELPPVTPICKKGKWINGDPICPCCGEDKFKDLDADIWADWQPKYCPNCGARMESEWRVNEK